MNLAFYVLIFQYTPMIGRGTGWGKYEFFLFFATGLLINSLVQTLLHDQRRRAERPDPHGQPGFRPAEADGHAVPGLAAADRLVVAGELRRWALVLGGYALVQLRLRAGPGRDRCSIPLYVACGVAIYYSLMIAMAATTVWLGRNQTLLDFWFYLTNFSRYPMEIYHGPFGTPLRRVFTFFIPVLIVVNVPARILVRPLRPETPQDWLLPAFALLATAASLAFSRWVFQRAMASYRSASS